MTGAAVMRAGEQACGAGPRMLPAIIATERN
jgi:hypothetical protein